MIRLKDIAERAGVSVMTVSKVLRDAPDISVDTKARIRLLSEQMGYVPDTLAQGLRTRKTKLIGVVISAVTNPIFPRVLMAVEDRAFQAGYEMVVCQTLNEPAREEMVIKRLQARRADGLIISPIYRMAGSVPVFEELHSRNVPVVIIGQRAPFCQYFTNVEVDDLQGGFLAAQHLLQLGHRRIAFFGGPSVAPWAQERLEGYRKALREAQIPVDDRLIFNAGGTIEEGEKTAQQFLEESPGATAIQCVNDLVAMGAAHLLLNKGFKIPEDFSLAGFGNILASEYFRVPLTTLAQPKHRVGSAAMDLLTRLLRDEKPDSVRLAVELVVRASTAPPQKISD